MVHTDPVPDESSWDNLGYKVIRGSCSFSSHEDLQNFSGATRRPATASPSLQPGRGLRLSLSLPCNTTGRVGR